MIYTGELIDELIEMVARAENRAVQQIVAAPEPAAGFESFAPRFLYDAAVTQPVLIGVA
jgi:hypothetical protein